jgi:hypothetical protein
MNEDVPKALLLDILLFFLSSISLGYLNNIFNLLCIEMADDKEVDNLYN